jgi:Na+-translocating ferredoxin:NAD+ oxidoreductase RNF subunit RnfB
LCGLGKSAPNPVLTTLKYFKEEYEEHVDKRKCRAGVCKAIIHYEIIPELCKGCLLCLKRCPSGAVVGKKKEIHTIIQDKCIKCGVCLDVCNLDAVRVI